MRTRGIAVMVAVWTSLAGGQVTPNTTQGVSSTARTPPTRAGAVQAVSLSAAARLQTALARAGFSPGLIDGRPGRKTRIAIEAFQRSQGISATGLADPRTLQLLEDVSPENDAVTYTIRSSDIAFVTGPIPTDWNERARLDRSGFANLEELLAETGWCSVEYLRSLNPGVEINALTEGATVRLPNVLDLKPIPKLARLEVDLGEKLVQGYDASDRLVFLTHCSIARLMEKRPVGQLTVKVVAVNPEYTFDPKDWPEVDNVTRRLRIAPGPRNPVGLAWIGLDKPGYGIHGTVRPQDIGKTGSHGCFRLVNWDAVRLARAVAIGTPVDVRE